ncbi:MAG: hypothetical protein LIP16_12170 [Clostridium sp.]|nr:hypothetical protein [Clostridium sp.]
MLPKTGEKREEPTERESGFEGSPLEKAAVFLWPDIAHAALGNLLGAVLSIFLRLNLHIAIP